MTNLIEQYSVNVYKNQPNKINTNDKKQESSSVQTKDGNKKSMDYLKYAGIIAAAAITASVAVYAVKHGKSPKLQDIKFDNGIASLNKSGEKYSGLVKDTLKNGDKIILEYKDGILQKSTRKGVKNFEKVFEIKNDEKIVRTTQNGIEKIFNITQRQNEVKESINKYSELIKNNDKLQLKEFQDNVKEIKFLNNNQKAKLEEIKNFKAKAEFEKKLYKRTNKNLEEITFKNGVPYFEGKKYEGKIHCNLKNGDIAVLEYDYSGLKKSEVTGKRNFTKQYNPHYVLMTENGETKVIYTENLKKEAQEKIARMNDPLVKQIDKISERINELKKKKTLTFEEKIESYKNQVEKKELEIQVKEKYDNFYTKYEKQEDEKVLNSLKYSYEKAKSYYQKENLNLSSISNYDLETPDGYCIFSYSKPDNISDVLSKNSKEYDFYIRNKDFNLDSDINLFENLDKKEFDIPERFAIMTENSLKQKGNAYICEETPKVLEGIDTQEAMDKLSSFTRRQGNRAEYEFQIGNKKLTAKFIGGGEVGTVYKLSDEFGNSAAMKIYGKSRGRSLNVNSGIAEIATSRQLKKDGVTDIPGFFMANAGMTRTGQDKKIYTDVPWMLSEFIDNNTTPKKGGKLISDWLEEHSMYYSDILKNGRSNGGYILDIGGMVSKDLASREWMDGVGHSSGSSINNLLEDAIKRGIGINDILKLYK